MTSNYRIAVSPSTEYGNQQRSQYNNNMSQKPHRPQSHDDDPELTAQMSNLGFNFEDKQGNAFAATAERSPGKIAGRNRDTAMFDPKRGTYMPYGGFDMMIDEYYTEGDPSGLVIPAPSQLKKREESVSPQRNMPKSISNPQIAQSLPYDEAPRRFGSPMERQVSANSGISGQSNRSHRSPQQAIQQLPSQSRMATVPSKATQYYDDEPYYSNGREDNYDYPMPNMPAAMPRERRGSNNSQDRPQGYMNRPPRQQYDEYDPSHQGQYPRDPRMQRPPPQQRPEYRQGRPGQYDPAQQYPSRDPRAVPRNGDPRMRPRPPQAMRPPNGQQFQQDQRYRDDGAMRQQPRQGPPPVRAQNGGAPYPAQAHDPRPQVIGQQPPMASGRSSERPYQQEFSRRSPVPSSNQAQAPIPSINPQYPRKTPTPVSREPSPQIQRPPQTQLASQAPAVSAPVPRPQAARTQSSTTADRSDILSQGESAGPLTLAELASYRKYAATKSQDSAVQLELVKKLIEASAELSTENGKADAKQAKKNRDDYNREALRNLKQLTAKEVPDPEALFFLANCYGNGALALEVDHERAFALYESAAKLKHPASAYRTAVCLEIGAGARQDVQRAVRFYERAAEYGDVAAMYKIGMIMLRGLLEQKTDQRNAVTWLQKAAEHADIDNPHALHELALLYEKGDNTAGIVQNEPFAKELFTKSAKLHYAPSQFRLGYAYEYGTLGCPVDPRRSIAWFSRGAERGDAESELSLSGWYLTGSEGILAQNDREAYLWGRKAAEKGLAKAEFAVGYFYESGIGTGIDIEEAIKWYKRAATAGQKKAQERLLALGKSRKR